MIKHLHFVQSIETLEGGGLGRAALELSLAFSNINGIDSYLVATSGDKNHSSTTAVGLFRRNGPKKLFWSTKLYHQAAELVETANVVHGHGFYVGTNFLLGRSARIQNKPLVYHPHGMFDPWILARSRRKKKLAHLLFEDANFRYAKLWRALTIKEADQIKSQCITAPIIVAPNGIDLTVFENIKNIRAKKLVSKNKMELLFLARLHPKKGLPILLEAWSMLPQALRSNWRIVIAGPDEVGHLSQILDMVKRLDLSDQVSFTGSVTGERKLTVLASADAFVLPSHSEGFSVAILEAMACRLPVLATHACNFPDLATKGGGWVVDDTVEDIKRALLALLNSSESELIQRGETAFALVNEAYTWPKIAIQLSDACESLIR